jgi:Domain of unknown function (DUF4192)
MSTTDQAHHAESAPIRVSSPTDLIAFVPYLLGFTPAESVVLVGLADRRIAVTVRTDVAAGELAFAAALKVAWKECDDVLLVVYTEHQLPQWFQSPLACRDALVITGGRWRSLLCANPRCCPPEGTPLPDVVPAVVAATIATGSAPMPTREDVIAALRPGTPTAEATAAAAELSPAHARDRAWFGIEQMHHTGQDQHATAAAYLDIAQHTEQDHRATGAWFLYAWNQLAARRQRAHRRRARAHLRHRPRLLRGAPA